MMVRGVGWRHGSGDAEQRIRLVVGGGAHAADDLVAVEEDIAILLLEELEEVRAPPAAVRGAALVVRLSLLGDVHSCSPAALARVSRNFPGNMGLSWEIWGGNITSGVMLCERADGSGFGPLWCV